MGARPLIPRRPSTTPRRWTPFAVAALVAALAASTVALAAPNVVEDRNDTKGVLDLRVVRFRHPAGEPPSWKLVTFTGWSPRKVWDRGYLYVMLDTIGDTPPDFAAQIRSDGRRMWGILYKLGKGPQGRDVVVSALTVRKGNPRSVIVKVPLKRLDFGPARTSYRWWAVTTLSGDTCPSVCVDRAPNEGSVLRYRPGMSPEPPPDP